MVDVTSDRKIWKAIAVALFPNVGLMGKKKVEMPRPFRVLPCRIAQQRQ